MSRAIDADALEKEGWSLHRTIRVDKNTSEYQTKPLKQVPTIEPRCEECEAFNKTRLLIPQPERKKGKWKSGTDLEREWCLCSECFHQQWDKTNYCPHCGADMREDAEEAKKCDTCKHVKEPWFNGCADCSDYELWESKE